ncbi:MAG: hypothetical protein RLZZ337_1304 [Bacteroidota bacterium]|jgi:aminopeptidase N
MQIAEQTAAQNTIDLRADTFDVLQYIINAAFLDYQKNKAIDANCEIQVVLKKSATSINLDLLGLNVSQVLVNGQPQTFSYTDPHIHIKLPSVSIGDTFTVRVFYNGNPKKDAQWGGFYFTGEYAFNMGVGFASDPHNFGRVWFPCFDNFTDRAMYQTNITVDTGYRAYANGLLEQVINNGDGTQTFYWWLDETIPTYLASVAIAKYEALSDTIRDIPITLTALAKDTANLRSSFVHLPNCIDQYLDKYGPHTFDRIGFNVVPFNAGAMEHATNIAYPYYAIADGSTDRETLFAHELAHHWWGNTITARTQEDMWLNEGWASFSESLFLEAVYGKNRYDYSVEANHRDVLQFAHIRDGESLPVSGIGWANTYGSHVYNKGADMVHTLRGFMGDVAFFAACKSFQVKYKLKDVSTDDLEAEFQKFTNVDLSGFFEQWIKTAGFAHFDIHWIIEKNGIYSINLKQTPRFNEEVYKNVPITISAFSEKMERYDEVVILNEKEQTFEIAPPFEAVYWAYDFEDKISDATTTATIILDKNGGFVLLDDGLIELTMKDLPEGDSVLVRVEHHWAGADGTYGVPAGVAISPQRYWNIDGVGLDKANFGAVLNYSGIKTTSSATFGYLDDQLIRITEDSLVLLYRPNGNSAWSIWSDYDKGSGSPLDKRGIIQVNNLQKGQYAFGMYDSKLANNEEIVIEEEPVFKIYPNPAQREIHVEFAEKHDCCMVEITNQYGLIAKTHKIKGKTLEEVIDISDLAQGMYFVGLITEGRAYNAIPFVVR